MKQIVIALLIELIGIALVVAFILHDIFSWLKTEGIWKNTNALKQTAFYIALTVDMVLEWQKKDIESNIKRKEKTDIGLLHRAFTVIKYLISET